MLEAFSFAPLALPSVITLIVFLSYGPQILFHYIEPSPLDEYQVIVFNILVCCTWVCYLKACFTDAGGVPAGWTPLDNGQDEGSINRRQRWCRRCETYKPPRAHHCKTCKR